MSKKLKIGVLFGGKSAEHEVSIESASFVIKGLDRKKYVVTPIKIPKSGKFDFNKLKKFDVVFPVFHGPFGEDGTIQGLLKLIGIPFVGASVLGTAVGQDKDAMKRLLRDAGIPVAKFIILKSREKISFEKAKKELGLPMFIKPANMGSSVGINKVKNKKDFYRALKDAFQYDTKIIMEEFIAGREIECGLIGNDIPKVSLPGEVLPNDQFFTYKAKYTEGGARVILPANLNKNLLEKVQSLAIKTYQVLSCEGMGRVDFFLKKNGEFIVNEINTIPGPVMFRKVWEASGMPFTKLLDELVRFALERFNKEKKLKNTFK
ncbi:MAG: D-alanine--D-alanine ligase family protein [bacterium]|nr:D-alanine--D-alanine ligase family protein [bacterium]